MTNDGGVATTYELTWYGADTWTDIIHVVWHVDRGLWTVDCGLECDGNHVYVGWHMDWPDTTRGIVTLIDVWTGV